MTNNLEFNEKEQLEKAKTKLEIIELYFNIWEKQNKVDDLNAHKDYLIKIDYEKNKKFYQFNINMYKNKQNKSFLEHNKFYSENFKIKKFEDGLEIITAINKIFKQKFLKNEERDLIYLNNNEYNLKTSNYNGDYFLSFKYLKEDEDIIYKQFELESYRNIKIK